MIVQRHNRKQLIFDTLNEPCNHPLRSRNRVSFAVASVLEGA
jgi:hypothetical protein